MAAARFWRVSVASAQNATQVAFTEVAFLDAAGADLSVGGVAVASSVYNATLVAANAFDKVLTSSSRWANAANQWPAWIGYDHGVPVDVKFVRILCDTHPSSNNTQCPPDTYAVTIQSSADGSAWVPAGITVRHDGAWVNSATVLLGFADSTTAPAASRALAAVTADVPAPAFATRTSRAQMARDVEFGGTDTITGTVERYIDAHTNLPQKARVSLLRARDKVLARQTWSDPATGAFSFPGIDTGSQHFITLAEYPTNPDNPHAENYMRPVAGVSPLRGQSDAG